MIKTDKETQKQIDDDYLTRFAELDKKCGFSEDESRRCRLRWLRTQLSILYDKPDNISGVNSDFGLYSDLEAYGDNNFLCNGGELWPERIARILDEVYATIEKVDKEIMKLP